mmetsp:Transcript_98957/g.308369  ORF Transcript_98957/g.308369 Transcript_98957/m.308369 type:complete len:293 (-) Transcript_98957:800-1678(-)
MTDATVWLFLMTRGASPATLAGEAGRPSPPRGSGTSATAVRNSWKSTPPSPEVSAAWSSSSTPMPPKLAPSTSFSSSWVTAPLSSRSKRAKVLRIRSSGTLSRPSNAAATNSLYSISRLPLESSIANKCSDSLPSTWKRSWRIFSRSLSVMLPRLCTSMSRNCSRNSICSSADNDQAIMLSAARRKCEASANARKLPRMPVSMPELLARWRPLIQGWSNASEAVSRPCGFCTSNAWMKDCAGLESWANRGEKLGLPNLIFLRTSPSVPLNTLLPVSSMCAMTPMDHTSACTV